VARHAVMPWVALGAAGAAAATLATVEGWGSTAREEGAESSSVVTRQNPCYVMDGSEMDACADQQQDPTLAIMYPDGQNIRARLFARVLRRSVALQTDGASQLSVSLHPIDTDTGLYDFKNDCVDTTKNRRYDSVPGLYAAAHLPDINQNDFIVSLVPAPNCNPSVKGLAFLQEARVAEVYDVVSGEGQPRSKLASDLTASVHELYHNLFNAKHVYGNGNLSIIAQFAEEHSTGLLTANLDDVLSFSTPKEYDDPNSVMGYAQPIFMPLRNVAQLTTPMEYDQMTGGDTVRENHIGDTGYGILNSDTENYLTINYSKLQKRREDGGKNHPSKFNGLMLYVGKTKLGGNSELYVYANAGTTSQGGTYALANLGGVFLRTGQKLRLAIPDDLSARRYIDIYRDGPTFYVNVADNEN
jgi:hypothetical protein